jgi:S-adenosylmethionine:tRNA ribosyltransferase-isomerase
MTSIAAISSPLAFDLPSSLEARQPPEARGLARDEVRLLVSYSGDNAVTHARFTQLPNLLRRGDVLVVNQSATVNAALPAIKTGMRVVLHLSQRLPNRLWVVELRQLAERGTLPLRSASAGEVLILPAGADVTLVAPYGTSSTTGETRLWLASTSLRRNVDAYLDRHGSPIRYGYVERNWPLAYYQTIFAREPGSAEMPSAARPFSARVVEGLAARGVAIARVVLHTGVSSLEEHEPPYAEYFRVDPSTARVVNDARARGGRIVAVGTTAVRALESVADSDGTLRPGSGWTELIVTAEHELRVVDALLTGFHEPRASHLSMLEALAGREHVASAYRAALGGKYLWHEFGDLHLVMPGRRMES